MVLKARELVDSEEDGSRRQAISPGDDSLALWAESPEEARIFLAKAAGARANFRIDRIFVAKTSPTVRHNRYIGGEYYLTSDDVSVDTYKETVFAPNAVTGLVQWCTCDVMISRGTTPIVVLEDTAHIVRMNVYQRLPRMIRAAEQGVPSVVLQGTRGLEFRRRGDRWALFRYLQAFEALGRAYPQLSPLPVWYDPDVLSQFNANQFALDHVAALITSNRDQVQTNRNIVMRRVEGVVNSLDQNERPPDLPSICYRGSEVIVKIGARPEKKSWIEKGSGQMDPYIGLIAAARYIYCYNEAGQKDKNLVVEFTYIPPDFPFFRDGPRATALYKRLAYEFADEVRFLG